MPLLYSNMIFERGSGRPLLAFPVLNRIGIRLGLGDKTVSAIFEE